LEEELSKVGLNYKMMPKRS